jgi:hypothetical protein
VEASSVDEGTDGGVDGPGAVLVSDGGAWGRASLVAVASQTRQG